MQNCSSTVVKVAADNVISRVGWMLPPYEAWCSAREGSLSCCDSRSTLGLQYIHSRSTLGQQFIHSRCTVGLQYVHSRSMVRS